MFAFTAATAFALLATIASAAPSNGIWDLPNAKATVYYDLTNSLCGNNNPFSSNWAETSGINGGIPSCESWAGANAKSLAGLGTNRIVAMDVTKVSGDLSEWCGKEVVIFDESGKQFQFSEGPLYIWDSCAAAASEPIVDLSAKAFTELKGGSCGGNNPTGLRVQVLNNNVIPAIQRGGGSSNSAPKLNAVVPSAATADLTTDEPASTIKSIAKSTTAAASKSSPTAAKKVTAAASPSPSPAASDDTDSSSSSSADASSSDDDDSTPAAAAPSASTGSCTFGAWQCNGKNIEVCNYVTTTSTAWVVSAQCPNACSITGSAVVCK